MEKDITGRLVTAATLQTKEYPHIFALGDCSSVEHQSNPATAQVAMQQAGIVAKNIQLLARATKERRAREISPEGQSIDTSPAPDLKKFKFLNLGEMLSLGLSHAALTSLGGWVRLKGPLASIGRRLVYCIRMPTKTQTAKALYKAGRTTTSKIVRSWFGRQ